jgi:hypothetical protein
MSRPKPDLIDWWFGSLSEAQRQRLMNEVDQSLDPDFALELWRGSGPVHVVEPDQWSLQVDPRSWRLTANVIEFVRARARERERG